MSSTMESKSASDPREHPRSRASAFDVSPSVRRFIADSDGNLDEKAAVAALSQTREQNKHIWIGCFVLIGVVLVLIAANIGTSVAVARLTRQLIVDPVTGMATIPGSDDVVMKTSEARNKYTNVIFHSIPTEVLSLVKVVEFNNGDISFDVKGYARMSNETMFLVEGGTLIFDINGLKNITGDKLKRFFSFIVEDETSSDLHGRNMMFFDMSSMLDSMNDQLNVEILTPPDTSVYYSFMDWGCHVSPYNGYKSF